LLTWPAKEIAEPINMARIVILTDKISN